MSFLQELKKKSKQLSETPFKQGWEFRVEFDVPASNKAAGKVPNDFDVYVKGCKYGGYTLDYVSKKIGTANINTLESKSAGAIEMTVRDSKSLKVEKFFKALANSVINDDGTVNLPSEYLFKMRFYAPDNSGAERLTHEWLVSAETCSIDDHSYEKVKDFIHYEASFKKHRS